MTKIAEIILQVVDCGGAASPRSLRRPGRGRIFIPHCTDDHNVGRHALFLRYIRGLDDGEERLERMRSEIKQCDGVCMKGMDSHGAAPCLQNTPNSDNNKSTILRSLLIVVASEQLQFLRIIGGKCRERERER